MNREKFVGADEGERDEGDSRPDGHEGTAGGGGLEAAVGSALAFGEEDERGSGLEDGHSAKEAGDGGTGAARIDGDLAGTLEVPAYEGDFPEALLGKDAELEGELGEEDWGVHVAEVVGGVYGYFGGL